MMNSILENPMIWLFVKNVIVLSSSLSLSIEQGKYGILQLLNTSSTEIVYKLISISVKAGLILIIIPPFDITEWVVGIADNRLASSDLPEYFWILNPPYVSLVIGLITGFVIGRMNPMSTIYFNRAKALYERCMSEYGEWFPEGWVNYNNGDMQKKNELCKEVLEAFDKTLLYMKTLEDRSNRRRHIPIFHSKEKINTEQQHMVLYYEYALALASFNRFQDALKYIDLAYDFYRKFCLQTRIIEEKRIEMQAKILILRGELLYVLGNRSESYKVFQSVKSILEPIVLLAPLEVSILNNRLTYFKY